MTKEIKLFKMINGEEIIATVVENDRNLNHITVEKVRTFVPTQTERGTALALAHWIQFAQDSEIELYRNTVTASPKKLPIELEKIYQQETSGIQFPTANDSKLIMGK